MYVNVVIGLFGLIEHVSSISGRYKKHIYINIGIGSKPILHIKHHK